jgi:hypothetical protein
MTMTPRSLARERATTAAREAIRTAWLDEDIPVSELLKIAAMIVAEHLVLSLDFRESRDERRLDDHLGTEFIAALRLYEQRYM